MDYYNNQTYYDILGLPKYGKKENGEQVSLESIRKAKDMLKFGNSDDRVPFWMWNKIDKAYEVLSDTEERKEYDEKLAKREFNVISVGSDYTEPSVEEIPEVVVPSEPSVEEISEVVVPSEPSVEEISEVVVPSEQSMEEIPEVVVPSEPSLEEISEVVVPSEPSMEDTPKVDEDYTSEFKPVEKNNLIKEKMKSVVNKSFSKIMRVCASIGVMFCGPTNPAAIMNLMEKLGKIKLIKDKNEKRITKISIEEVQLIEKYNQNLDNQINKLLSEKHNNYKLEICREKYKNQIELLMQILNLKINTTKNKNNLSYRLELVATKMQLISAESNLEKIEEKIKEYNASGKKQKLTELNADLINKNIEIAKYKGTKKTEIENELDDENKKIRPIAFHNLEIKQSRILKKLEKVQSRVLKQRDRNAQRVKLKTVRDLNIYNSFIEAKDFVKSLGYIVKSEEVVDDFITEGLEFEFPERSR